MKKYLAMLSIILSLTACGGGGTDAEPADVPRPVELPVITGAKNMPAGFQVIGDHGYVQIDENYFNMVYKQKGTVATFVDTYNRATMSYTGVTGSTPMVFVKSSNSAFVALLTVSQSGNTFTYEYAADRATTISYWIFDKAPAASSTTGGLEVLNSSGELVYSSSQVPLKIVQVAAVSSGTPMGTDLGSGPGGSGAYANTLSQPRVEVSSGIFKVEGVITGLSNSSTGNTPVSLFSVGGSGTVVIQPNGGLHFVADVTGL
jgi:hypothetical protein